MAELCGPHGIPVVECLACENATLRERLREYRGVLDDYKEVLEDKRRLAREIDVALNGEDGAAEQASLCDLVGAASKLRARVHELEGEKGEEVKFANIRLIAAVLYAYCHKRREGWEEGPGPNECWDRLVDEVCNLGLAGVEVAGKWLEDNRQEILAAQPFDVETIGAAAGEEAEPKPTKKLEGGQCY